jgi:hypothetical protein
MLMCCVCDVCHHHAVLQLPRAKRNDFLRCVVWLLARGLLVQLHTYVFLLVPPPPSASSRADAIVDVKGSRAAVLYDATSRHLIGTTDAADAGDVWGEGKRPCSAKHCVAGVGAFHCLPPHTEPSTANDTSHAQRLRAFALAPAPLLQYERDFIMSLDDGCARVCVVME